MGAIAIPTPSRHCRYFESDGYSSVCAGELASSLLHFCEFDCLAPNKKNKLNLLVAADDVDVVGAFSFFFRLCYSFGYSVFVGHKLVPIDRWLGVVLLTLQNLYF